MGVCTVGGVHKTTQRHVALGDKMLVEDVKKCHKSDAEKKFNALDDDVMLWQLLLLLVY